METEAIYQKREKLKNRYNLFKFISKIDTFTKLDISNALNLSIPTVSKIVDDFLSESLIIEIGASEGGLGRKSAIYKYNPNAFYSLGILIESCSIKFLIVNLNGDEIKKTILKKISLTEESIPTITKELKLFVQSFETSSLIKGIGISVPAIKLKNENFNSLIDELKSRIYQETKIKVLIDRIGKTGAIFEYSKNSENTIAFLNIGNNIEEVEMALIVDGKPLGNGKFIEKLNPDISNRALTEKFQSIGNENNIKEFNDIFNSNLVNTEQGKSLFDEYMSNITTLLKSVQMIADVEKIVVGGAIAKYAAKIENIFSFNEVEFSENHEDSILIGAAFLPLKEYFL